MSTLLFRPQDLPKRFTIKERLKTGRTENYNFRYRRGEWYPAGYRLNKKTLSKQFGTLHYLACHSPAPIAKKWNKAYTVFYTKHFGSHRATARYLNKWSCHAWL